MSESEKTVKRETIEEYIARGGKIQVIPPRTVTGILKTFSARKIRSSNTASFGKERARRSESKVQKGIK